MRERQRADHHQRTDLRTSVRHHSWRAVYALLGVETSIEPPAARDALPAAEADDVAHDEHHDRAAPALPADDEVRA